MITESLIEGSLLGLGMGALLIFVFYFALLIILGVFLYKALALYTIAKKLGSKYSFLAWIPIAQFFLYPLLAEERWEWGFIALIPILAPILFFPFSTIPLINMFLTILILIGTLILVTFRTYWIWKIFEKRNYHGALSLLTLVNIVNLFVLGVVAWIDKDKKVTIKKEQKIVNTKTDVSKKNKKTAVKKKTISKKKVQNKRIKK